MSRAHFHPKMVRVVFAELPVEDCKDGMLARLLRPLYGARDAAHEFDKFANISLELCGYAVGKSSPCIYRHKEQPSIGWRHGDDICLLGEKDFVVRSPMAWRATRARRPFFESSDSGF